MYIMLSDYSSKYPMSFTGIHRKQIWWKQLWRTITTTSGFKRKGQFIVTTKKDHKWWRQEQKEPDSILK